MARVVHVTEDAAGGYLRRWDAARSFDHDIQRSHARLDPEGRVNVGDQPRARDGQPVDWGCFPVFPGAAFQDRRTAPTRRNPRLPVNQQHRPGGLHPVAAEPVEIDPGAHGLPRRIGGVPTGRVKTGRPLAVHQGGDPLAQDVEHLQPHVHGGRQLVGNHGGRIERIGIVGPQVETLRQGSGKGCQRQGEMPRSVRGGRQWGGAQVG